MVKRSRKVTILVALLGLAVYLLAVFPTRSYLLQRSQVRHVVTQVNAVQSSNAQLQHQIDSMNSPSEIEKIARSQYGLIKPGEKAFVVLPPATTTTTTAPTGTSKN